MAHFNAMEMLERHLQVIRIIARDNGASITELVNETGIERWGIRNIIKRIDSFASSGNSSIIEVIPNELDKRETRYHISKDCLWTLTIPRINLTNDESLLLSFLFMQAGSSPVFKESAESLRKKLCMFKNADAYEVMNAFTAKKISNKKTQQIMLFVLNAIHDDQCIRISYKPVRREITDYKLMPLCVFKYEAGFYLAAQKLPDGEYRTFGLERVQDIPEAIDYTDSLPEKVDYKQKLSDPFGPFGHIDEFEAVLKFDSFNGFFNLEKNWPDAVKIETLPDESVIMRARTCSTIGIKKWLLSFGVGVEVLEPEWLRDEIRDEHKKAERMYLCDK